MDRPDAPLPGLDALPSSLQDQRLAAFALAWRDARGTNPAPCWHDLDVRRFAAALPNLWAWTYDHATGVFHGKIAGEEILQILGRGFRGALAHEFYKGPETEMILARHRRVAVEGLGFTTQGPVFHHAGSGVQGQRVALPAASRGRAVDIIVGVTVFHYPAARTAVADGVLLHEQVQFYDLH